MSPKRRKRGASKEECLKRVAELEAALQEEKSRSETYLNQLKYARADLENLQKQMQRRIDEAVERGALRLITRLLPIVEELDLAVEAAREAGDEGLLRGVEMVKRKLDRMLDGEGISPIETVGASFDPYLHEAVLEVETDDYPDGTVIEEVRRGYLYRGRVIRASMVKVARNSSSKEDQEAKGDE